MQDLTARKELEGDLHRISAAVANARDGISISDPERRFLYINRARAEMHGYADPTELIGQPGAVLFTQRDLAELHPTVEDAIARDGHWHGEATGRRRDGSTFPQEISITDIGGGHLVVVARDITDRRATEERLQASEERYRLATRATQEVIWDADLTSRETTLRGAVPAVLGFPSETVTVDTAWWEDRLHPEDRPRVLTSQNDLFASAEETWTHEYRFRRQDDAYITLLARGYVVRQESGHAVRFIGSMMDISERKKHEEQLKAARQEAEEANQAKSLFLANMSHEIRTPMNGVLGMTELLRDTQLDPVQENYVETVHRSGEQLLSIINDILDISKIEAGKMPIEVADFNVAPVIEDATSPIAMSAAKKGLDFECFIDPKVPPVVTGDSARVCQVLANLVANAVKFTDTGRICVRVEVAHETEETVDLLFAVEDSGIGVTAEEQSRLFQSFSQADSSTTRRYGGTGLGLAICKELVQLMDGTLGVDSTPGEGSTFWFRLPLGRAGTADRPRADLPSHNGSRRPASGSVPPMATPARGAVLAGADEEVDAHGAGQPRLLLAEDSPVNQMVAKAMLDRLGYAVDVAADGVETLELFTRHRYAAVLMDVQMPRTDGYEATAAVRAHEASAGGDEGPTTPRTPIIAMTANALAGDKDRALASGMDDYLAKPYRSQQLAEVLGRWVETGHPYGGSAPSRQDIRAAAGPPDDPVDRQVLAQLRDLGERGGTNLLERVVPVFLRDARSQVAALNEAITGGDTEAVESIAHRLRENSANVGAHRMTDTCTRLETVADTGQLGDGSELVANLMTELAMVQERLEDELRRPASS